jgi:hypothetical protein
MSRQRHGKPPRTSWTWNKEPGPAQFGISPVESFPLYLYLLSDNQRVLPRVCPGTPLIFSTPEAVRRVNEELKVSDIQPADYRLNSFAFAATRSA